MKNLRKFSQGLLYWLSQQRRKEINRKFNAMIEAFAREKYEEFDTLFDYFVSFNEAGFYKSAGKRLLFHALFFSKTASQILHLIQKIPKERMLLVIKGENYSCFRSFIVPYIIQADKLCRSEENKEIDKEKFKILLSVSDEEIKEYIKETFNNPKKSR